jgi:hypothetical protein
VSTFRDPVLGAETGLPLWAANVGVTIVAAAIAVKKSVETLAMKFFPAMFIDAQKTEGWIALGANSITLSLA